jgi:hypothetical protein
MKCIIIVTYLEKKIRCLVGEKMLCKKRPEFKSEYINGAW